MFDGAFVQMIENLVAGYTPGTCQSQRLFQVIGIEIADAPGSDLAGLNQVFHGGDRFR